MPHGISMDMGQSLEPLEPQQDAALHVMHPLILRCRADMNIIDIFYVIMHIMNLYRQILGSTCMVYR